MTKRSGATVLSLVVAGSLAVCAARGASWDERVFSSHLDFDAIAAAGPSALPALIERGRALFKAKFTTVDVPRGTKLVTAFLAPYDKKDALSSKTVSEKINRLGHSALEAFMADPTLDTLAYEGERFSGHLGLESPEVRKLLERAKSAGADYASQNMIGYSIHSIVNSDVSERVAESLRSFGPRVRVDVFQVGTRKAGII